jgi:hypothetical protein
MIMMCEKRAVADLKERAKIQNFLLSNHQSTIDGNLPFLGYLFVMDMILLSFERVLLSRIIIILLDH